MNYTIINDVEYIENIKGLKGHAVENQKIIEGHKITKLDMCYEMVERALLKSEIEKTIFNKAVAYLKRKDVPHAVTEEIEDKIIYHRLFVYGKDKFKEPTSSSKKLHKPGT